MSSLFTSRRERRLWCLSLSVVLVVFSTLALTARFVGSINEGVLAAAFLVCLISVGVTIVTQGLRVRPRGIEIGITIGIVGVFLLLGVRMAIPERSHLMEYGILAILVFEALTERAKNGRRVGSPSVVAFVMTSLVGILDECIQWALPNRVFDWEDILFNVLAALAAIVGVVSLRWVRLRSSSEEASTH